MVVAGSMLDLFVGEFVNALPHNVGSAEVEGRSFHLSDFARRNAVLIDRDEEVGVDFANCVHGRRGGIADTLEREEAMAGHIDNGLFVRRAPIVDDQFVLVRPGIAYGHRQFTGKSLFIVGRNVA